MNSVPMLTDADVAYVLGVPKLISDPHWRQQLLPMRATRTDLRARLDLEDLPATSPIRGRIHLYTRQNLNPGVEGDWSTGLIFTDYAGNTYRIIRCNGPHPTDHTNTLEGDVIVRTAHIHLLTERYQWLRRSKPDGFAMPTNAYKTIDEALEYLAGLANLQAHGRLFL